MTEKMREISGISPWSMQPKSSRMCSAMPQQSTEISSSTSPDPTTTEARMSGDAMQRQSELLWARTRPETSTSRHLLQMGWNIWNPPREWRMPPCCIKRLLFVNNKQLRTCVYSRDCLILLACGAAPTRTAKELLERPSRRDTRTPRISQLPSLAAARVSASSSDRSSRQAGRGRGWGRGRGRATAQPGRRPRPGKCRLRSCHGLPLGSTRGCCTLDLNLTSEPELSAAEPLRDEVKAANKAAFESLPKHGEF